MSYFCIPLLPVDNLVIASRPWELENHKWQNLQDLQVVLKYKFSNSNISSRVVSHFDVDTSSGHEVTWLRESGDRKLRTLYFFHPRSTVD